MRIAVGSDHAGFDLKERIARRLAELGHEVVDCGTRSTESVDYPDFAAAVAREVASRTCERGVLCCGTGIGVAMAAGKVKGVRAATVHDRFTAQMSREHNDANVLCLGARVLDPRHAVELAELWITVPFAGGRHERRVKKIDAPAG
ncbi:MAG TPA: ribose 5-phosphate isomerase B [Planctomycetota bacterium]|nr:ribose 5-phosphate isomerase B [Planctomycetota bacterium]